MAANGGKRPGAGRKPKAEKNQTAIEKAEKRIRDRLPELIDNLFALANGITVQEEMPNGGMAVYSRAPDRAANEYLMNRVMGKPKEHTVVSTPRGSRPPIQRIEVVRPTEKPSK